MAGTRKSPLERCILKVKASKSGRAGKVNPFAVCRAALKKGRK